MQLPDTAVGEAPGKAILMGEHFVVHGAPALAVPVPGLCLRVRLRRLATGCPPHEGHLGFCMTAVLPPLGLDPARVEAQVESNLPVGSGMGSSAALSVALARAAAILANEPHKEARERELSMVCEAAAHGRPSGIDTEVCVTGQPVWAEGGRFSVLRVLRKPEAGLVVLMAGAGGATSEMVARVADYKEAAPARFESLAHETRRRCLEARRLMESGSMSRLGVLFTEQHQALREIGVSTPGLDVAVRAACEAGAYGAKLSGAGGGGAVVALVPLEATASVAESLAARGLVVAAAAPLL